MNREGGEPFTALALETSSRIDPMNNGRTDEVLLEKGEVFRTVTSYSVKEKA